MKITYLSNTSIPSDVASAIQIVKMCEAFSINGNVVNLVTTNVSKIKSNIYDYYDVKNKFKIFKINYFKTFPLGLNYYLFSFFSILKGIQLKTDIYITRNYFTCFLLILIKKKIIMELHHGLEEESRIVQWLFKYTKFINSKHVIKIVAITNAVKNYYIKNYSLKENKFQVLPSGSSIKKKFKFKNFKKFFNIGYFGSIYKSRGYKLIIKLAKLDKKNNYYIYGNINNKNSLFRANNINKNLHWNNYIPYKEIPKNLDKMDILIMPYVSSITTAGDVGDITNFTSPLKLFDYLRVGKIIICSDIIVLREILKNNNAIFIKNFSNPYSWMMEINKISMSNEKQYIMSKNNYKLGQNYSLNNRAKKY